MMRDLTATLDALGCRYYRQEKLATYTTFRIGGKCPILIQPTSAEQISAILRSCSQENLPYLILGKGSNLLISDAGTNRVVLHLGDAFSEMKLLENNRIVCAAGAPLSALCRFAMNNRLSGLEFAYGIPGSVGGATYMNAGAYGGEMKDVLVSCTYCDERGTPHTIDAEQMQLGYRHSVFSGRECCITSVTLQLTPDNPTVIRERMDDLVQRRKLKQPLDYPSAGSTFKRPEGNYAAALIEKCGLKGRRVGGAQVSEKHAGFIVNTGGATFADVSALIEIVRQTVLEQTGYRLECEVQKVE